MRGPVYNPAALCGTRGYLRGYLWHPTRGKLEAICRKRFSPSVPSCPTGLQNLPRELPGWPLCSHLIPSVPQSPPCWRADTLSCQPIQSPWGLTCPGSERSRSSPDTHTPTPEQTAPLRSHAYGSAPVTGEFEML